MLYIDSVILNLVERAVPPHSAADRSHERVAGPAADESEHRHLLRVGGRVFSEREDGAAGLHRRWSAPASCTCLFRRCSKSPWNRTRTTRIDACMKGLRNPRRVRDALLRISFLLLSVALLYPVLFVYADSHIQVPLLTYSLIVLTTAVLYLLACDPLPPSPETLKEPSRESVRARVPAPECDRERGRLHEGHGHACSGEQCPSPYAGAWVRLRFPVAVRCPDPVRAPDLYWRHFLARCTGRNRARWRAGGSCGESLGFPAKFSRSDRTQRDKARQEITAK